MAAKITMLAGTCDCSAGRCKRRFGEATQHKYHMASRVRLHTLIALLMAASVQIHAQTIEAAPALQLPAISSRWPQPGEIKKDEIRVEDVGQCLGVTWNDRRKMNELANMQLQLEGASTSLQKQGDALRILREALQENRDSFENAVNKLAADDSALDASRTEIDKYKTHTVASAADAKRINKIVAAFNAKISKRNRESEELKTRAALFSEKVKSYNATADSLNKLAVIFGERVASYEEKSNGFRNEIARFNEVCAGTRRITK